MATYLDSSAIVKLAIREPESAALRRYLRRKLDPKPLGEIADDDRYASYPAVLCDNGKGIPRVLSPQSPSR